MLFRSDGENECKAELGKFGGLELVIMVKLWIPVFFPPGETEHKAGFKSMSFRA